MRNDDMITDLLMIYQNNHHSYLVNQKSAKRNLTPFNEIFQIIPC